MKNFFIPNNFLYIFKSINVPMSNTSDGYVL
jgi:hypothetical protein